MNPNLIGTYYVSSGHTQNADYTRTPAFTAIPDVQMQVQAVAGADLKHLDSLNIQGTLRAVWVYGNSQGVNRDAAKGGDVLMFKPLDAPAARYWLVVHVMEAWDASGWSHVIVQLQTGTPDGIA